MFSTTDTTAPSCLRRAPRAALALCIAAGALGACNLDGGDVATESVVYPASTLRYASRSNADHPAWGNPRWSMQYAHNGRCDDPRYRTSNGGLAEPGSDEHDCARFGDGLR